MSGITLLTISSFYITFFVAAASYKFNISIWTYTYIPFLIAVLFSLGIWLILQYSLYKNKKAGFLTNMISGYFHLYTQYFSLYISSFIKKLFKISLDWRQNNLTKNS